MKTINRSRSLACALLVTASGACTANAAPPYNGSSTGPLGQDFWAEGVNVMKTRKTGVDFAFSLPGALTPTFIATALSRRGVWPEDYKLPSDGSDDAPSIQRAANSLCASPGYAGSGGTLNLLPRVYEIDSSVNIPCALDMIGQGWEEQMTLGGGTWLHITSALGTANSAFILGTGYSRAAQFKNFAVTEDHPTPSTVAGTAWTPTPYQPVFSLTGVGAAVFFDHILWDGVYEGIYASGAGRIEISGMYSDAFKYLIKVDGSLDVNRFRNIHEWPYWTGSLNPSTMDNAMTVAQKDNVSLWRINNTNTIVMGRTDTPFLDEIFSYGTRSALDFVNTTGNNAGRTTKAHIGRLSCDKSASCITVEAEVTNQASMIIDQIDWQGGGVLSTDTLPISGGSAINIQGAAAIQIGNAYAESIGATIFNFANTSICSNIRLGTLRASFLNTPSSNASPVAIMPICGSVSYHEIDISSYSISKYSDGTAVNLSRGSGHFMVGTYTEANPTPQ